MVFILLVFVTIEEFSSEIISVLLSYNSLKYRETWGGTGKGMVISQHKAKLHFYTVVIVLSHNITNWGSKGFVLISIKKLYVSPTQWSEIIGKLNIIFIPLANKKLFVSFLYPI